DEVPAWRRDGAEVRRTVDRGSTGWDEGVGVVTQELGRVAVDGPHTVAMICGPEVMMRATATALLDRGVAASRIRVSLERNMQCGVGLCGHCQVGPYLVCRDGPVLSWDVPARLPSLAVWKFSSCDGCQLTLLDCEDELLALAGRVRIAQFLEASRAVEP